MQDYGETNLYVNSWVYCLNRCCDETPAAGDPPHLLCKKVKHVRPTKDSGSCVCYRKQC